MEQEALHYIERGWHLFPLRPRAKTPLTLHGVKDASTDPAAVRSWWRRWPDANIGLACGPSGLVVIDVDRRGGGIASWLALKYERYAGLIPDTLLALTGGGGFHVFFGAPAGVEIRNSAGFLGVGLDVKSRGGYVVLPPSVHPSGARYQWGPYRPPGGPAPTLAALPPILVELLHAPAAPDIPPCSPSGTGACLDAIVARLAGATPGQRNNVLLWAACRLFDRGLLPGQVEALLLPPAVRIGLTEREACATLHSAARQVRRPAPVFRVAAMPASPVHAALRRVRVRYGSR